MAQMAAWLGADPRRSEARGVPPTLREMTGRLSAQGEVSPG